MIQTLTNTNIEIPEGKEEIDMCQAIDDMLKDSRKEGRQEGWLDCQKTMICAMYEKGMSIEEIADIAGRSREEIEKAMN